MKILNSVQHPYDSSSILNWVLWRWSEAPQSTLIIITHDGDGEALSSRLRVKLSNARKIAKRESAPIVQFGIRSEVIKWTIPEHGTRLEGLCLNRIVTRRHTALEILSKQGFKLEL